MTSEFKSRILIVILYTISLATLGTALLVQYGFPLDDSYIYQTVGRAIASGKPAFIPGQAASGATSLLWVYLQALKYKFFQSVSPVAFNFALSWVLLVLIGQLLYTIVKRDRRPFSQCWLLAASPALCGNFIWLGMIGMEHLLFVALSLAAIVFWFQPDNHTGRGTAVLAGACLALLALTRPEAMALGPLLLIVGAWKGRRKIEEVALAFLCWLGGVALFFIWEYRHFQSLMPATFQGRIWLWFRKEHGPHSLPAIAGFFRQWLQRLPRLFSAQFTMTQMRLTNGNRSFTILVLALLILALIGSYSLLKERPLRTGFLLLWAFVHGLSYLVLLPALGQGGRYQPLFLLLAFPLILSGSVWIIERIWNQHLSFLPVLIVAGFLSLSAWRRVTIVGIEHINNTHGKMAIRIAKHLPLNARVGTFDIGRISYDLDRPVTDLGGLIDPGFLPYLETGRVSEYLKANAVEYVVIPEQEGENLGVLTGSQIAGAEELIQFCSPYALWATGYSYTEHAFRCQRLYRLTYR